MPQGSEIAGWWLMSKGAVLGSISKARCTISSRGASGPGSGVAIIGTVGISSTS